MKTRLTEKLGLWVIPVILVFQRLKWKDCEFKANLSYTVSLKKALTTE